MLARLGKTLLIMAAVILFKPQMPLMAVVGAVLMVVVAMQVLAEVAVHQISA
jgi:uncharacterized membrane protein